VLLRTEFECLVAYAPEGGIGLNVMYPQIARSSRILVVEDVQETRDAIEILLKHDGYRVDTARNEQDAVEQIKRNHPDLILISLQGSCDRVIAVSEQIRARGGLDDRTPIVIFSLPAVAEGAEEELAGNIHVTLPDNFNQLRSLITRLLRGPLRGS
jgi:CheY-like chemotaxis protein